MAAQREGSEARSMIGGAGVGPGMGGAVGFHRGRVGLLTREARTADEILADTLNEISRDAASLNRKMIVAVRLLAEKREWCETVRLLIGVGEYRSAEIAEALGVMRSTVSRWFNGETAPQKDQTAIYFKRLLAYMQETRPFDLHVDPKDLIHP